MAVSVIDRDNRETTFAQGTAFQLNDFAVVITDVYGKAVGAYNNPAWSRVYITPVE